MHLSPKSPLMFLLLALSLAASLSSGCDPGTTSAPDARPPSKRATLAVGQPAPQFVLKDQAGKERCLNDFLGKGMVALVFHRSASW